MLKIYCLKKIKFINIGNFFAIFSNLKIKYMLFSDILAGITNALFSPDNQLLAVTNGTKIIIKSLPTLENIQVFSFPDQVSYIEFSPDSKHILAVMSKKNMVEARSISEEDWLCKIEDNLCGLIHAKWAPDSRHIITFSDFQLKASIYSLVDKTIMHIKYPKFPDKGISFSNDGKFMALAERREAKDFVGIYYCGTWKLVNHFQTETYDLSDISWSPDNNVIIVWETLLEYKILAYCPATGLIAKFQPYQSALGIKTVNFNKSGEFLSIGSYDEKMRLLNCLTWKLIIECDHQISSNTSEDILPNIFKEEEFVETTFKNPKKSSQYIKKEYNNSFKIPCIKVPSDKPNPQLGVGLTEWSHDGQFIASRNDNMPSSVWIWEIQNLSLIAILVHLQQIKNFSWSPNKNELAICTGNGKIFFWSPEGAYVCDVPYEGRNFSVHNLKWSFDGNYIMVLDKNECVIVYPNGVQDKYDSESKDSYSNTKKLKSVKRISTDKF